MSHTSPTNVLFCIHTGESRWERPLAKVKSALRVASSWSHSVDNLEQVSSPKKSDLHTSENDSETIDTSLAQPDKEIQSANGDYKVTSIANSVESVAQVKSISFVQYHSNQHYLKSAFFLLWTA